MEGSRPPAWTPGQLPPPGGHYEGFYREAPTGGVTSSDANRVPTTPPAPPPQQQTSQPAAPQKTWVDSLMEHYGPEINQLKGLAIGTLGAVVRQMVADSAPPPLADSLKQMVDGVTEKLGGRHIEGDILESLTGSSRGTSQGNGSREGVSSGIAGMTGRDPVVGRFDR